MLLRGNIFAKDKEGNIYRVSTEDPRLKSGELVHITKGTVLVKRKDVLDRKAFRVSTNDPRLKSGELVGYTKGKVVVKDKNGKVFSISKDSEDYKTGEFISVNKGKVSVIDKQGNRFHVSVNDPRLKSGELVGQTKGYSTYINKKTFETVRLSRKEYLKNPDLYVGISKYVVVRSRFGVTSIVLRSDPRIESGELIKLNEWLEGYGEN